MYNTCETYNKENLDTKREDYNHRISKNDGDPNESHGREIANAIIGNFELILEQNKNENHEKTKKAHVCSKEDGIHGKDITAKGNKYTTCIDIAARRNDGLDTDVMLALGPKKATMGARIISYVAWCFRIAVEDEKNKRNHFYEALTLGKDDIRDGE